MDRGTLEKRDNGAAAEDRFVKAPYTHQDEAPLSEFHLAGVLTTAVPVQELDSPSHQLDVRASGLRAEITLADSERLSGNRDVVLRYRLAGDEIASGLLLYQGRDENFFLLVAEPPQTIPTDQIPAREYIFVLDVSGSMNGFPLDTAKKLMGDLVNVLRPSDTFNIVVFADGSDTFAPASVPATRPNLARALQFLNDRNGGGGTRLLGALEQAVAIRRQPSVSRSIVLVTDGYIDAESAVFDYIRDQRDDVNFFAFGIGSSVNRFLIEGVAGWAAAIVHREIARRCDGRRHKLRRYIDTPVQGIGVKFTHRRLRRRAGVIPDLFASRPIVVIGRARGRGWFDFRALRRTGRGAYQTSIPVSPGNADTSHSALRHLWWCIASHCPISGPVRRARNEWRRSPPGAHLQPACEQHMYMCLVVAVREMVRRSSESAGCRPSAAAAAAWPDLAVGVTSGPEPNIVWTALIVVALLGWASLVRMRRRGLGVTAKERLRRVAAAPSLGPEATLCRRAPGTDLARIPVDGVAGGCRGQRNVAFSTR